MSLRQISFRFHERINNNVAISSPRVVVYTQRVNDTTTRRVKPVHGGGKGSRKVDNTKRKAQSLESFYLVSAFLMRVILIDGRVARERFVSWTCRFDRRYRCKFSLEPKKSSTKKGCNAYFKRVFVAVLYRRERRCIIDRLRAAGALSNKTFGDKRLWTTRTTIGVHSYRFSFFESPVVASVLIDFRAGAGDARRQIVHAISPIIFQILCLVSRV